MIVFKYLRVFWFCFIFIFLDAEEERAGSVWLTMRGGEESRSHTKTDFSSARETSVYQFQPFEVEWSALWGNEFPHTDIFKISNLLFFFFWIGNKCNRMKFKKNKKKKSVRKVSLPFHSCFPHILFPSKEATSVIWCLTKGQQPCEECCKWAGASGIGQDDLWGLSISGPSPSTSAGHDSYGSSENWIWTWKIQIHWSRAGLRT